MFGYAGSLFAIGRGGAQITSVSPNMGNDRGGTSITINGQGFTGANSGSINGVALNNFTVVSDTTITAKTGSSARGTYNLVISKSSGNITLANGYTYLDALSTALTSSTCSFWLRGDKGITTSGGAVSAWNDQTGSDSNKNLSQGTGTKQPTNISSSSPFNNRATVSFDGGDQLDTSTPWLSSLSPPFTIYIVARQPTPADSQQILINRNGTGAFIRMRDNTGSGGVLGSLHMYNGGAADVFTNSGSGLNWSSVRVCAAVYDTASSGTGIGYVSRYNTTFCSGTNTGTTSITGITLGATPGGTQFFIGEIAEVIIYNTAHNSTERQNIMQYYLGDAYGVSISA